MCYCNYVMACVSSKLVRVQLFQKARHEVSKLCLHVHPSHAEQTRSHLRLFWPTVIDSGGTCRSLKWTGWGQILLACFGSWLRKHSRVVHFLIRLTRWVTFCAAGTVSHTGDIRIPLVLGIVNHEYKLIKGSVKLLHSQGVETTVNGCVLLGTSGLRGNLCSAPSITVSSLLLNSSWLFTTTPDNT